MSESEKAVEKKDAEAVFVVLCHTDIGRRFMGLVSTRTEVENDPRLVSSFRKRRHRRGWAAM